jgi:hypothetical protein
MVQFRLRLFVDLIWTLCPRPIQAARARSVTKNRMFSRSRPLQNTRNALAVLAGAIPWEFKSPSPHHKMSFGFISLRPPFFRVTFL